MRLTNIFSDLPSALRDELVQVLLTKADCRIERIVSHGHASPPGFWYDQNQDEWVIVLKGEAKPASCLFHLPPPPGAKYFDALVANIEKLFNSGQSPYPVERTLLTSGILDFALESHHLRGARVETPELDVRYTAPADSGFLRGSVAAAV